MHLIIDADPIVYRCGFAAERADYHLVVESPGGEIRELHFTPQATKSAGDQMRKWTKAHPKWTLLDKSRDVHPDSLDEALANVRTQLNSIEKACRERHGLTDFTKVTVLLSGPGNYREALATIFPYKGNRDPEHKPHWYQQIRDYLTGEWGALVVHGREADDECSILARADRDGSSTGRVGRSADAKLGRDPASTDSAVGRRRSTASRSGHSELHDLRYIIATIDKDLDQIPGWHYNYLKQVHYVQSAADARAFFFQQCLSGDATDGIPGCWKIGETKAIAFLGKWSGHSDGAIWEAIVREYAYSQKVAGCPYVGGDPAAVALETARLVYLQQKEGELWNPPGTKFGQVESDDE